MSFLFSFKSLLIVGLLVGTAGCLMATKMAKDRFGLATVQLGMKPSYKAGDFAALMTGNSATATDRRAARFVAPILFPIDLLLLACLGGFLAMASLALGSAARIPAEIIPLLVIVPVLYVACDLAENCLFAWLLLLPDANAIPENVVDFSRLATIGKLFFAGLGAAQVIALLAAGGYFHFRN